MGGAWTILGFTFKVIVCFSFNVSSFRHPSRGKINNRVVCRRMYGSLTKHLKR